MGAAPENVNKPEYTDPSFPNASKTDVNISEYNLSPSGTEMYFLDKYQLCIYITICVISIFGAVGNVAVIWLLGFRIKRNPFMTYILNLAVADLGVLLSAASLGFYNVSCLAQFLFYLQFQLMYSASQCLLTAISIDRCVAVFFPLWHRCKRPPHLSTLICAVIWVFSLLLTGITSTLHIVSSSIETSIMEDSYQFILNAMLCLPIMTTMTVALFIKVCLKAGQHRRGRLLTIILLTLLFFILFAFPLNVLEILFALSTVDIYFLLTTYPLACLNSSINPVIYFLVGRQWKSRRRENMKTILQEVFKEEEGCMGET